jgi:hypothetical protein
MSAQFKLLQDLFEYKVQAAKPTKMKLILSVGFFVVLGGFEFIKIILKFGAIAAQYTLESLKDPSQEFKKGKIENENYKQLYFKYL